MLKYTIRRLLLVIPLLLCVVIIVFSISYFMPGDPVLMQMPANYTQEQYDAKAEQLGLDKPYAEQLWNYIVGIVTRFDLGKSYSGQNVSDYISGRIWVTLKIGLLSCLVTIGISVPVGIISATKQYSVLDYTATTLSIILASMPGFWLALMMVMLFALKLGWLPATGLNSWRGYIMPVLCNATVPLASTTRQSRSSMLEVIRSDYIRTARAKGLPEHTVILKHALRNALIPIITVAGIQFSHVIGGSVIVESIFNIPGMGSALVSAIGSRDYPCIVGITFITAIFVSVINVVVDVVYAMVDPRIKAQIASGGKKKKKAAGKKTEEAKGA